MNSTMLFLSLNVLPKVYKTKSPKKLVDYDCMTLYEKSNFLLPFLKISSPSGLALGLGAGLEMDTRTQ